MPDDVAEPTDEITFESLVTLTAFATDARQAGADLDQP